MVKLTTLSDSSCKKLADEERNNLGNELYVNKKIELCGAFIGKMNVTLVEYKKPRWDKYKFKKPDLKRAHLKRKYKNIK